MTIIHKGKYILALVILYLFIIALPASAAIAPNIPIITSPITGQTLSNNTPTITWTFSSPLSGATQGYYQVAYSNNYGTTWVYGAIVNSSVTSANIPALTSGTWEFAVITWDQYDTIAPSWGYSSNVIINGPAPSYGLYNVQNQTTTSYDIYIYNVSSATSTINRIQFPTWTTYNGQDDLASNWYINPIVSGTNLGEAPGNFT